MNDANKITNAPVNGVTLVMAVLVVTAVEIPLRAVAWGVAVSPMLALGISRLVEGMLIAGVVFAGKNRLSSVGLSGGTLLSGFRRGLFWSAGFGGVILLAFLILRAFGADPLPLLGSHASVRPMDMMLLILVGGMISPLTEELFFRGVLYGFLRRWGVPPAVMLSSLAFVLAHMTFTENFFIPLTGGLLFAVAYEIEKNLMVPITLHILGNIAIFTISCLPR